MLLPKFLSRKISPEKSLDFLSQKSVAATSVRVGQRLPSRFGQRGAARELNLVQIVLEAPEMRGGLPSTQPSGPVFGWRCRNGLRGLWRGASDRMDKKICKLQHSTCVRHSMEFHLCIRGRRHSFRAADVPSTTPKYELGKVAFSSMFLKRKKSQRFGASSFSKCHYTRRKIPLPPQDCPTPSKKSLCNRSHLRTLFLPYRFIKICPISDPSALNFSQFVGFQDSPNLNKIEKVAEACEFDGKEPLFVERSIAFSKRVLG